MIQETRRDGPLVVVAPEAAFPARCVKCNAECGYLPVTRKICTLSAWYPLFASAGWNAHCPDDLPVHIPYGLCLRHRLERLGHLALMTFFALANLFCFTLFNINPHFSPTADLFALILPLPFMATALTFRPILRPRRVHHGLAWFTGAGPEFLDSLTELEEKTRIAAAAA
jgi:hypothetical protein